MVTTTSRDRSRAQGRVRWELLVGLVRKDLKVKYQGSVLGFLWSLANPLLLLVVYTFVFQVVLKSGIPQFGFYLLSGLLVWNMFAGAVGTSTAAVVGNSGLVKKVRFPLSVLPLSQVGFALVHFVLQLFVLLVVMAVTGNTEFAGPQLLLAVPAIAVALLFTVAVSFLVAGLNVRYRDTQHVVEVVLMAGFWVNPIVYSVSLVQDRAGRPLLGVLPEPDGRRGGRHAARALRAEPDAARRQHRARLRRVRVLPGEARHRGAGLGRRCSRSGCGSTTGCPPTSPRSSEWAARSPSGPAGSARASAAPAGRPASRSASCGWATARPSRSRPCGTSTWRSPPARRSG